VNPADFRLTAHAIKRLRERFPMIARNMDQVSQPAQKLKATYNILQSASDVTEQLVNEATERWHNRHNDSPHAYFRFNSVLFIGRIETMSIVTVVNWDCHNKIVDRICKEEAY